jgi:hypothetical protein
MANPSEKQGFKTASYNPYAAIDFPTFMGPFAPAGTFASKRSGEKGHH